MSTKRFRKGQKLKRKSGAVLDFQNIIISAANEYNYVIILGNDESNTYDNVAIADHKFVEDNYEPLDVYEAL